LERLSELCSGESAGIISDCSEGIVLAHASYTRDTDMIIHFGADGGIVGKRYGGSRCSQVYRDVCGGEEEATFFRYVAGTVSETCTPRCELCEYRYQTAGDPLPQCDDGGAAGSRRSASAE
jgi:hypothetical protein